MSSCKVLFLALKVTAVTAGVLFSLGSEAGASNPPRQLVAKRTNVPPVIDGRLDEPCWHEAAVATGFSVYSKANVLHPEQTIGRVCYDDDNLYISLECAVEKKDKLAACLKETKGEFQYLKAGVVEIFLDTNHDRRTFQQYLLHANGSSLASPGEDLKILDQEHLRSASSITAKGFNIEAAFPLAMLHLRPGTGRVWGFNLNRVHGTNDWKPGQTMDNNVFYSSWNSTLGQGFPKADLFGELILEQDLSRYYWDVNFAEVPRPGNRTIKVRVKNETGRDFSGKLSLTVEREKAPAADYEKKIVLKTSAEQTIDVPHFVSAEDIEAKFKIVLTDDTGKVCYLGGTQKKDLTPGDSWPAPSPSPSQQKAGYIVFHRPWSQPVLHRSVPRAQEIVSELSVSACREEFEPVTLELYPLRDFKHVSVSVSDLTGLGGAVIPSTAVVVRKSVPQSDWKDIRTFEAKEHLLRRCDGLALVKGQAQRLWLTVRVPDQSAPGTYLGKILLTAEGTVTPIALTIQVLPFKLANTDDMGFFMYFPYLKEASFNRPEFFRKIARDMREHGMTTFTIYHGWTYREDQKSGRRLDLDSHAGSYGVGYAELVNTLMTEGFAKEVPLIDMNTGWHYGPAEVLELDRTYRERGWPKVVYYVGDEIDSPERLKEAGHKLEVLRKASATIKFTTTLGDIGVNALGHMYDVWIGCSTDELVKKALSRGKQPWTYCCRQVGELGPAFVRYFFGVYPWKSGLKGLALWCYTEDNVFLDRYGRRYGYGEFTFTPDYTQQHGHVYFEDDQIIPTVTWEAVREGIDDLRYLRTLKNMAEIALLSGNMKAKIAAESGMKLLKEITEKIDLTPAHNDYEGSPYLRDWRAMGDMDSRRSKVIEAILEITKANER